MREDATRSPPPTNWSVKSTKSSTWLGLALAGSPFSTERGRGLKQVDFSLSKYFAITERQSVEFRAEAINAFNTPILLVQGYSTDVFGGSNFGVINSSTGARNLQFALKYRF